MVFVILHWIKMLLDAGYSYGEMNKVFELARKKLEYKLSQKNE